jgi:hypothetical protein
MTSKGRPGGEWGQARVRAGRDTGLDRGTNVRIAMVGAGSWGTTGESMPAERYDTVVWAASPRSPRQSRRATRT